jgi:hypothetical protein
MMQRLSPLPNRKKFGFLSGFSPVLFLTTEKTQLPPLARGNLLATHEKQTTRTQPIARSKTQETGGGNRNKQKKKRENPPGSRWKRMSIVDAESILENTQLSQVLLLPS